MAIKTLKFNHTFFQIIHLSIHLIIFSTNALAGNGGVIGGGGGGELEPTFKEVANNISKWIESGNADLIENVLPTEINLNFYKTEMLRVLKNYNITFTTDKVMIGEFEKTCKSFIDKNNLNQIICNIGQFGSETPENIGNIYRQVHHEFAGLACRQVNEKSICVEQNINENSDYRVSNLITAFLGAEIVFRLPILPGKIFGDNYICKASIANIDCGTLDVSPNKNNISQDHTTGIVSTFNWYKSFPYCPELALFNSYTSQRRIGLVLAEVVNESSESKSWAHINQIETDSTVGSIHLGSRMRDFEKFASVECYKK